VKRARTAIRLWLGQHRRRLAAAAAVACVLLACGGLVRHINTLTAEGEIGSDHALVSLRAPTKGTLSQVVASVGDHVGAEQVIFTVDPHVSADQKAEARIRRERQSSDRQHLEKALEVVTKILKSPELVRGGSLSSLGVSGDTFGILDDLYVARLKLDNAVDSMKVTVPHQKAQVASELELVQRTIDLLKRNLDMGRKAMEARTAALHAKRQDFAALLKLADKGLVPATDVNRERESLLQAEVAVSENQKSVDQIELDISNRTLHLSELRIKSEGLAAEASSRYNGARLDFELRLARLGEHKKALEQALASLGGAGAPDDAADGGSADLAVRAGATGVLVSMHRLALGESVQEGDVLATVHPDTSRTVVLAHVPVSAFGRIRIGQRARVVSEVCGGTPFANQDAVVTALFFDPHADTFTASLALGDEAQSKEAHAALIPGMKVRVHLYRVAWLGGL
jgi:multidrug resistance efflux pump